MEKAFVSWSGGKDCSLACYRARQKGIQVSHLLNMVDESGQHSRSHGLAANWLQMQAKAIGISLLQRSVTSAGYEAEFTKALQDLKLEGITTGIFGDIDFNAHKGWIDRVCSKAGITPVLPLWEEDQTLLFREFIGVGFEAIVVATRADLLGEEWLGRKLDANFLADLIKLGNITPCGEAGEYHTLVVDGPPFRQRLEISNTTRVQRDGRWFLDIGKCELRPKAQS